MSTVGAGAGVGSFVVFITKKRVVVFVFGIDGCVSMLSPLLRRLHFHDFRVTPAALRDAATSRVTRGGAALRVIVRSLRRKSAATGATAATPETRAAKSAGVLDGGLVVGLGVVVVQVETASADEDHRHARDEQQRQQETRESAGESARVLHHPGRVVHKGGPVTKG